MERLCTSLLRLPDFEGSEYEELNIQLKVALDDFNAMYGLVQVVWKSRHFANIEFIMQNSICFEGR